MFTLLKVVLGFAAIIGLHELAHMLVSKFFGVKVLKFALGFGPILLSKKFGDTSYELRALPLGGFVQCEGEDPESDVTDGFFSLPWWKRALIAVAGPLMNLFLGFLFIYALLLFRDWPILAGAARAFAISKFIIVESVKTIFGFGAAHSQAGTAAASGQASFAGPIMITKVMFSSAKEGMLLFMLGLVSLSIGLFNLFPIPAMDGGHLFLYLLEGIRGKKFSTRTYIIWNAIGFILLGLFMLAVCFSDIMHL